MGEVEADLAAKQRKIRIMAEFLLLATGLVALAVGLWLAYRHGTIIEQQCKTLVGQSNAMAFQDNVSSMLLDDFKKLAAPPVATSAPPLGINVEREWRSAAAACGMGRECLPDSFRDFYPKYVFPIILQEFERARAVRASGKSEFDYKIPPHEGALLNLVNALTTSDKQRFFLAARILFPDSGFTDAEKQYASENIRMLVRRPIQGWRAVKVGVLGPQHEIYSNQ